MVFDRPDGNYSPIERAALNALGMSRLEFRPTGERERIVPERVKRQAEVQAREEARLRAAS